MITVITGATHGNAMNLDLLRANSRRPFFNCPENFKSTTEIVHWAEWIIINQDSSLVVTMNCDVVSAIRYISEFYGKQSEFILVDKKGVATNYGDKIDPLFKEFNKSLELISKFQKD